MKKISLIAVAALALASSTALPARADESAKAANQLLVAQALDAVTTRLFLAPTSATNRTPLGFERDPIVRPFVKTDLGAAAVVLATNLIARTVFRRSPKTLRWFAIGECGVVGNNVRVLSRCSF